VCLSGLALAALLAAVVFKRRDLLFVAVAIVLMIVLSLASLLVWRRPARLVRQAPLTPVPTGSRLPIVLRGAGKAVVPREPVFDLGPWDATRAVPTGPGSLTYWLRFARRGVVPIGPAMVQRIAPFGLARLTIEVAPIDKVLVAPRLFRLPVNPLRFDAAEHSSQTTATGPKEVDPGAVRPYQAGDPRTKVHWRATARRGKLMVRQDRAQATTDVWVVLDNALEFDPATNLTSEVQVTVDSFELAVSAAASLVLSLMDQRHIVHLLTTSGQTEGPFRQSGGRDPVMASFAKLEASPAVTDWSELLANELPARGGQVPVYLLLFRPGGLSRDHLARTRAIAEPAEALLMPLATPLAGQLRAHGWQVTPIRETPS